MVLWGFQVLLNVIFVAVAWTALLYRRRVRTLERRLAILEARSLAADPVPNAKMAVPMSTNLTEREAKADTRSRDSMEAYEKAAQLLARGSDPFEVSRKTGLSLSEVQLMGKVSQRNH